MTRLRHWVGWLKFLLVGWTVTPQMLKLNEQRPYMYQLFTTPVVTLTFSLIVVSGFAAAYLLGL